MRFNPHSLTGVILKTFYLILSVLFQSTLPYGSDSPVRFAHLCGLFQSTLPYGSDSEIDKQSSCYLFQSTLPYGSDSSDAKQKAEEMFQSTLPYGSDSFICVSRRSIVSFNPHSLTGVIPC